MHRFYITAILLLTMALPAWAAEMTLVSDSTKKLGRGVIHGFTEDGTQAIAVRAGTAQVIDVAAFLAGDFEAATRTLGEEDAESADLVNDNGRFFAAPYSDAETFLIKHVKDKETKVITPEAWVLKDGGEIAPPRRNGPDHRSAAMHAVKGMPTNENAMWAYTVTGISPDGRVIIGNAKATQAYERADRNLSIKKNERIAVYWTTHSFLSQASVGSPQPLALELDQPKFASNPTINKVTNGLKQAMAITMGETGYLIAGKDHANQKAILVLPYAN